MRDHGRGGTGGARPVRALCRARPPTCRRNGGRAPDDHAAARARIADFIAGMTDRYAHGRAPAAVREYPGIALDAGVAPPTGDLLSPRAHERFQALHRTCPRLPSIRWPRPACSRRRPRLERIVVEPPREASHGDLATNAAMVLAKDAGLKPRDLAEKIAAELEKRPEIAKTEIAGPGFINLTLDPAVWREALATAIMRAGRITGEAQRRRRPEGQCRIRLGQSDRADACRPLPRRGVRRCAGQPARVRGLRGDARVLHQRCRRAGRRARALGVPALPRGARREHRRDPGRALSRRLPQAGRRRRSRRSTATSSRTMPKAAWLPLVREQSHRDDDGHDHATISPRSTSSTTCSSPSVR